MLYEGERCDMKKFLKIILTMIIIAAMIVVAVRGVEKLKLAQNEKNIVGTWENSNLETVITFLDNGKLILNEAIADVGLSNGEADYYFSYADTICITQDDVNIQFEVDIDSEQLTLSIMGNEYWILQRKK